MHYFNVLLEILRIPKASSIEYSTYYFQGKVFCPQSILPVFKIKLVGKLVSAEVEVIHSPLDYNLLLGRSWTYTMCSIPSVVLRVVVFPHEGKLVNVDQIDFTQKGRMESNESVVPLVD